MQITDAELVRRIRQGGGDRYPYDLAKMAANRVERLSAGLERAKSAIQTLGSRLPPGDFAAQQIVTDELKLALAALHPEKSG